MRAKLPSPGAGRKGKWPEAWPAHWLMPEPTTSNPPNVCWPVGGEIDIMEGYRPRTGAGPGVVGAGVVGAEPGVVGAVGAGAVGGAGEGALKDKRDTEEWGPGDASVLFTYHWAAQCGKDEYAGGNERWPLANDTTTVVDWTGSFHSFAVEWSKESIVWFVDGVKRHERRVGTPPSLFIPTDPFYMILNTGTVAVNCELRSPHTSHSYPPSTPTPNQTPLMRACCVLCVHAAPLNVTPPPRHHVAFVSHHTVLGPT